MSLLKSLRCLQRMQCSRRFVSAASLPSMEYERNPEPLFNDAETQHLLKSITQLQLQKIFRKTAVKEPTLETKLMSTDQLELEFRATVQRAQQLLQMPPIVQIKQDEQRIISKDVALTGYANSKFVFTDITYGVPPSKRKVLLRQTDGTLQYAPLDVAKRMNQLYFPLEGRKFPTPRMFEPENLQRCLDERKYEFILNRLCVQYEPYETEFHRISSLVYQHLNESKEFDQLRSTRHFGPMAFFYAWHRCIDELLLDMIRRDYLCNGAELVMLYYKLNQVNVEYANLLQRLQQLHDERDLALEEMQKAIKTPRKADIQTEIEDAIGKTREDFEVDELCLQFIKDYVTKHALKKVQLELALQTLQQLNAEKKQLFDGLHKAHGVK